MRRAIVFLFVFILLAGIAGGLGYFQYVVKPNMIRGFIAQAAPPPATVAAVSAEADSWAPSVPAIGTFRAFQGVDIAPQIAGIVKGLSFESGQDVAKGAVLAQIDDTVEQADLASNTANLKNADLALDRQKQLITGAVTTKATLDQAQAARDQAAAAVDRSKALIAQKALAAPFAGRLGLRKIDIGQYVSPGTSIVTLQQVDPILVDFPIPEQNYRAIAIGQVVDIAVDSFPNTNFAGKVKSIDARIDPATRNVTVRAEVPNPDKRLLPGMFANVRVAAGASRSVVTLPRTAVSYSLYGDSVYVLQPAGDGGQAGTFKLDRRVVKTGDTRGDRVAIADGVQAGDRVVSEGQVKLQPNATVRVDNAAALPPPTTPRPRS